MFTSSFLDELRSRLAVSAVVGRKVALTKKGREFEGLCPFHNEKTPSFTVNDEKGFYHCFGCGAHGDVIEFTQHHDRLSFVDAVEKLAADAGLEIPKATPEERAVEARRGTMLEALDAAASYYEKCLQEPGGAAARTYLESRGVSADSIARFRLGWAPGRDGLKRHLYGPRFPEDMLVEAGLLRQRDDDTTSDLFYGRLMFPITDKRGRVIAFGGRVLDASVPKYINSPETPLFHKGCSLYGLAHARIKAADASQVVVAEGYLDVIALHQAGLERAVAPLGTALTTDQLAELWRLAPEVMLCLDGDKAGQAAMERAVERALPMLSPERQLRFSRLPAEHDPDSLIQAEGLDGINRVLGASREIADVVWSVMASRHPIQSVEARVAFERALYAADSCIEDAGTRRTMLSTHRRWLADECEAPAPVFLRGQSKSNKAPPPGDGGVAMLWATSRLSAEPARQWLKKQGVDLDGLDRQLGGIGYMKARVVKGKHAPGTPWDAAPAPALWEPGTAVTLVIIPDWPNGPSENDAPTDLIGWHPKTGDLSLFTGGGLVLGADLLAEAWGFEARGLSRPVVVADGPLSWLQKTARGERSVLLCDWGRAWEALGSVPSLVVGNIELGERLQRAVRPPKLPLPRILVAGAAA